MNPDDAKYYEEQINTFTACKAVAREGELEVDFLDGSPKELTFEEARAHELYQKARKVQGS